MMGKAVLTLKRMRLGLTDYRRRRKLILSGLPRFTVRFSNRYILIQLIEARLGGDYTIASFYSRELSTRYGWKASCINTPAAYLSGLDMLKNIY
jgi:large subunit ribosomal protein L18